MSLAPPVAEFTTPAGRVFTVDPGEHSERYPGDPLWSDGWPILLAGKRAGTLYRNLNYGTTPDGLPRWQAQARQLFWACEPEPPTGLGFDVVAFDTAAECLAAWAVSADQILDWDEGKPVSSMYSKKGPFQKRVPL